MFNLDEFGISDSSLCSFCAVILVLKQRFIYLFCNCQFKERFQIQSVVLWICHYFKRNINVSNFNKIFGFELFEN